MPNKKNQYDDEPRGTTRYGMDGLGAVILVAGLICIVLSFFGAGVDPMLFTLPFIVGVVLVIYEAYRATSTDLAARAKENQALSRRFKGTVDKEKKERLKKERAEKRQDSKEHAAARKREREKNRRDEEAARKKEEAAEREAQEHPDSMTEHCPECGQSLRVPRGKGTIRVTCPKCKKSFILHT